MDKDLLVRRELCPKNHLFFSSVLEHICFYIFVVGSCIFWVKAITLLDPKVHTQWAEINSILHSPLLWRLGLG